MWGRLFQGRLGLQDQRPAAVGRRVALGPSESRLRRGQGLGPCAPLRLHRSPRGPQGRRAVVETRTPRHKSSEMLGAQALMEERSGRSPCPRRSCFWRGAFERLWTLQMELLSGDRNE